MHNEYKTVIVDTSCFILLSKIGEMEILKKIFGVVCTTTEVEKEFRSPLPEWVKVLPVKNEAYQQLVEEDLDKGEASIVALNAEMDKTLLILDDYAARKFAEKLGLNYTGTLGIFLKAKERGLIFSVKSMIQKIQQTNFRFSERVITNILEQAGEL